MEHLCPDGLCWKSGARVGELGPLPRGHGIFNKTRTHTYARMLARTHS